MSYTCPICGWPELDEPPHDEYGYGSYDICPSCGVEYGYQDCDGDLLRLRREWVAGGMVWQKTWGGPPAGWDPAAQLVAAERAGTLRDEVVRPPRYVCPVCGWHRLAADPLGKAGAPTVGSCDCCGTEYGGLQPRRDFGLLRQQWTDGGSVWQNRGEGPPPEWDPRLQLLVAERAHDLRGDDGEPMPTGRRPWRRRWRRIRW